jgi:ketosteroid isomerase-like protein
MQLRVLALIGILCMPVAAAEPRAAAEAPIAADLPAPTPVDLQPSVALPPELARVLTDYEAAWRSRDAAALARLFAEDGFVLPNGRPPVRGRAAIRDYYTGHGGPLALRAIAFATEGAVGYIIGGYAPRQGEADDGKFTLTLRKDAGGRWLIVSDMDSSNRSQRIASSSTSNASVAPGGIIGGRPESP